MLSGQSETGGHEIVQAYWKKQHTGADFDTFWRKSLHDGWIEGTAFAPKQVRQAEGDGDLFLRADTSGSRTSIEINFRRDPSIYDGQFANNGWLQELPKPMNKLTWDNPVLMGPDDGRAMGISRPKTWSNSSSTARRSTAPVWIQAGHPDNSVTVFLGYGRRARAASGTGAGFDVYPLRTSARPGSPAGQRSARPAALTSWLRPRATRPWTRRPARVRWCVTRTLEEYRKEPDFAQEEEPPEELTLYKPYPITSTSLMPGAWRST